LYILIVLLFLSSMYVLMRFLGRIVKYFLRSLSSIILFLLLVWLAKTNRNVSAYISFLDSNDWSIFQWSQPATWSDPFWQNTQISGDIADMLSGDIVDAQTSGLDVYDPAFEEDLNSFTDTSSTTEDYWFTTSGQITSDTPSSSGTISKAEMLRQRKLAQ